MHTKSKASPIRLTKRRQQIIETLQRTGEVRVTSLSADLGVSEVTIRNDLAELEAEGALVRDHGGATLPRHGRSVTSLPALNERANNEREAKRRIAIAAAKLVTPGDALILDAGTTVVEMAQPLSHIRGLRVVTNAVNVATAFGAMTDATVLLLGGTLHRDSGSLLGATAEQGLQEMTVDTAFLGAQALDLAHGVSDTTPEIAQVKRAMARAAKQVVLLVDSSKWDSAGFIRVLPLEDLDTIITDRVPSDHDRRLLAQAGVSLTVV